MYVRYSELVPDGLLPVLLVFAFCYSWRMICYCYTDTHAANNILVAVPH